MESGQEKRLTLIQEYIDAFGIKNFFFYWIFLYWRNKYGIGELQLTRKSNGKVRYEKGSWEIANLTSAKIHDFSDFFWLKSCKNVSVFCNFLTRKSQETHIFYCRQEFFVLSGFSRYSTQALLVFTAILFPSSTKWW